MSTQQQIKQIKNVAVALVRDEEGNVLLTKPSPKKTAAKDGWGFPSNDIIPGATYTETFVSEILEKTGCIIEAVALISSEKYINKGIQLEFVECKVVTRDATVKIKTTSTTHLWVHPTKVTTHHKKKVNSEILEFLGV